MFPLREVVLFPDTQLRLHVFEPRYRKMLADALDDDRLIGMVLIRDGDPAGEPPVYPIGCVGKVVGHEPLSDGRSLIILRGIVRFRIQGEVARELPYRLAEAQALYEAPAPAEHMRAWRAELREDIDRYLATVAKDVESLDELFARRSLEQIVNCLSAALPFDVVEKQSLLECATVEQRFRRLCELVRFRTAEAALGMESSRDADA